MADVARLAGVSVPTVSRVFSGATSVTPETRERVERIAAQLRFRPSATARALASGRSAVIAVLAGNTTRYGYAEAIRGVEEAARTAGFSVLIAVMESPDDDLVEQTVSMVANHSVAGVVVLKFDAAGVRALSRVPSHLPLVALAGEKEREISQAVLDESEAAERLTRHLLELGHETVHHVRVPSSVREDGRTAGWRRALEKAGAPIPDPLDASWRPRSGVRIGLTLASDPSVSAVFCGNDEIAMGVMRGLFEAGLRVPQDVSVAGFDDHPLAELWVPALTTARQDFAELGRRGVRLLLSRIGVRAPVEFSSETPDLILRASTAPPDEARRRPRQS
jgi:DNA-binding LacI/PurR family transcriptional regulator